LDEEELKYVGLAQENGFDLTFLPSFFEAGKGHSKGVHLLEKSMIDTI
jgi:hypothetical protein